MIDESLAYLSWGELVFVFKSFVDHIDECEFIHKRFSFFKELFLNCFFRKNTLPAAIPHLLDRDFVVYDSVE